MSCREEAIVIEDDSDSETECNATAAAAAAAAPKRRAPVTRSSAKKARQVQVPTNDVEAHALVHAAIASAAPLCKACLCRDRARGSVDSFLGLLTSVPELATARYSDDDGGIEIDPLPIQAIEEGAEPTLSIALGIVAELQRLDDTTGHRRPLGYFNDPVRLCDARMAGRATSIQACTGLLRDAVADALVQLPHVIVDVIVSFVDVVHDHVDRPLLRDVYAIYVRSIRVFLEAQQAALRAMETSSEAHRLSFDEARFAIISSVEAVAELARTLRWNHANGNRVAWIGQLLRNHQHNFALSARCYHSVSQADAARDAMTQRWAEVEAEMARLTQLGFRVNARHFY
jgi:hypothetical protein